jgi:hypothetical protein
VKARCRNKTYLEDHLRRPETFDLIDQVVSQPPFMDDDFVECVVGIFDHSFMDISGDRKRSLVLPVPVVNSIVLAVD